MKTGLDARELQSNTGNLVRIEGGCATVMGYKFPQATVIFADDGKAEARIEAHSQDICSIALVVFTRPGLTV